MKVMAEVKPEAVYFVRRTVELTFDRAHDQCSEVLRELCVHATAASRSSVSARNTR